MTYRKHVKTALGTLAMLILLGLIVVDFLYPEYVVSAEDKALLFSLVAGLLGVKIGWRELPFEIRVRDTDDAE